MKNARISLLLVALTLSALPVFGQALGFQITTDHAGFISMPGFEPPLQVKWSVHFEGTASYPIITGGKVFAIDSGVTPPTLYALDANTGATLWAQPVPSGYGGWIGFAYENGGLFGVTTQAPGFSSGAMFAFSASDGHQVWMASLPGQYSFSSAPTARNGMVYTGGAGSGGTVYAVKESTGQVVWTAPVENGDSSAPAVTDTGVYVSYACPQTYRFDPKTGEQIWHYSGQCEGGGGESPAVYKGLVFVRDLYNFPTDGIALSTAEGSLLGGANSQYSPAFADGNAVLTEPTTVTAVKVSNGHPLWTATVPSGDHYACSPLIINDVVYVATDGGYLYAYAGATGDNIFSFDLGQHVTCGEYFAVPLVGMSAGEGLLVVPDGPMLVAMQAGTLR